MRKFLSLLSLCISLAAMAQESLPLDSCRQMALRNNKEMRIADAKVAIAGFQKKQAEAAYLPGIDFAGGYTYNQKELSIFDSDQLLPTKSFNPATGQYEFNLVTNPATGAPITTPDGHYIPSTVALIPKEAMTYNIHHVFAGAVTLTQPVYMGGKIVAMNKITRYAEEIARDLRDSKAEDIIYNVDAAYWQVVSLAAKKRLAEKYSLLLDTLNMHVEAMFREGVATRADVLSVAVKNNEAKIVLTKVENGLTLSKMHLAQLCGMPICDSFTLADEGRDIEVAECVASQYNMQDVYSRRKDVNALATAVKVARQQQRMEMSAMLPNVALVGAYSFSNPNMFDGFKREFSGAFSVGAVLNIPIWHWGGNYNKYRAAKAKAVIRQYELEDVLDKVELQVAQASFKAQEAVKTYNKTILNLSKADENLHQAQIGFREGVLTATNVMEAQTAWLQAHNERIDAGIDVNLCKVYLSKVLGTLDYNY